jgi:hypothetical protein
MQDLRLKSYALLFCPALLYLLYTESSYYWVWNRTSIATPISWGFTLLAFLCMRAGLRGIRRTKSARPTRALGLLLTLCIFTGALNWLDDRAVVIEYKTAMEGEAYSYVSSAGAFGNTWSTLYISEPRYGLFRRDFPIKTYIHEVVDGLRVNADGSLELSLRQAGKQDWIERFTKESLNNKRNFQ